MLFLKSTITAENKKSKKEKELSVGQQRSTILTA
jgi:hypothetical protein